MASIEKCLAAYERVLDIYKMNNDNYLKRTQIVMIVAQSAIFYAFVKVFTLDADKLKSFTSMNSTTLQGITLIMLATLGALSALVWIHFIVRQCNVLSLCKAYMRTIEDDLMRLGVPLGYWTYEGMVSHPESYNESELGILHNKGSRFFPSWLFPDESKHLKIGLTRIEKRIACFLFFLWTALLLGISVLLYTTHNNLPKELDMFMMTIYATCLTASVIVLAWICVIKGTKSVNNKVATKLSEIDKRLEDMTEKLEQVQTKLEQADTPPTRTPHNV